MMFPWLNDCCALCHDTAADNGLCAGCLNDLTALYRRADVCPACAADSAGGLPCPACRRTPPPLQHCWGSVRYAAPLPAMLHQWKHLKQSHFFPALWTLMRQNPPPWLPDGGIDGVLAMPVSRQRRLQRGFNQSGELAHAVARHFSLPLIAHHAVVRRHAPPQSTLNLAQRLANIRHGFRAVRPLPQRHILLIDDIMTTGSSLFELANTLHALGIRSSAWVLCRHQF